MRDGWLETNLGKYIHINTGKLDVNAASEFGEYPFFTCSRETYRIDEAAFEGESVLVAGNGDLNVKYFDGKFNAYQRTYVLNSVDRKILDNRFLFLYMQTYIEYLRSETRGTVIQYLKKGQFTDAKIKLPPLPEQKRIVDLISSVDSYIEALQQQLENAKRSRNALVESQVLEVSNSSLSSLKNLSTKIGSGATPRGGEEVYIESGVNLIRSQNVHDSNFVMRGLVAIEDSAAKALENVTVEEGDVLINITGASVTRCCVVDSTILPARVNQHVAIIRPDTAKILPKYLVLVLTSNEIKGFLNDIAGTGSTRQALTKTHLEDLEIPVPDISKQAEIIENSDAFDFAILKSQLSLDEARILRAGLLKDLLSGEHEIPANYDKVMGAA